MASVSNATRPNRRHDVQGPDGGFASLGTPYTAPHNPIFGVGYPGKYIMHAYFGWDFIWFGDSGLLCCLGGYFEDSYWLDKYYLEIVGYLTDGRYYTLISQIVSKFTSTTTSRNQTIPSLSSIHYIPTYPSTPYFQPTPCALQVALHAQLKIQETNKLSLSLTHPPTYIHK
ncbi:hypothetical protein BO78DRAFT_388822 [Aspergillus sclerotiicarbonarius CBS 121057]|uniref:Uncharacterized protein n=1 Tax=Aspergillus sclerotiicarbonarius (strain CBS 121057 / IBT 28362) TaxID=1448318 RepID=A0A319EC41_ASPSB|nr:hypothetical protein BO78DRAFT_388822 [Aspergillus sclerotiicarbonarius CBS 121057]